MSRTFYRSSLAILLCGVALLIASCKSDPLTANRTMNPTPPPGGNTGSPATLIFASEDGIISAWNTGTSAVEVGHSSNPHAVYKGIAMGELDGKYYLYVTNFHRGTVDVYDEDFKRVHGHPFNGSHVFKDQDMPHGYAPFGIANIGGQLYVTYAQQDADKHDDVAGSGHGYIDVYDLDGTFVKRFASQGTLNSPWGIAKASSHFGTYSDDIIVGNFGDGKINVFNTSGTYQGQLLDHSDNPLVIDGLWGIFFSDSEGVANTHRMYFAAGPGGESGGAFGYVHPTGSKYQDHYLVTNTGSGAPHTDAHLINGWGLTAVGHNFWVSANGSGLGINYRPNGQAGPDGDITIPSRSSSSGGTPTGVVYNGTTTFLIPE